MNNNEQYVPSEDYMRRQYVVKRMHDGATRTHAEQEYARWLAAHDACVRRDAWDEGYDTAAEFYDADVCLAADNPYETGGRA